MIPIEKKYVLCPFCKNTVERKAPYCRRCGKIFKIPCPVCGGEHYRNEMEKFCPAKMAELEKEFYGKRWQIKAHKYLAPFLFVVWLFLIALTCFLSPTVFNNIAGVVFLAVMFFGVYLITYHPRACKEWKEKKEDLYRERVKKQ